MAWEAINERRDRIAQLTRQGLDASTIASMLHINVRTVQRAKKLRGLTKPPNPLTTAEIERAKALLDDGACYAEVERTIGRSHGAIYRHLPGYAYSRAQIAEAALFGRMMASLERDEGFHSGTGT